MFLRYKNDAVEYAGTVDGDAQGWATGVTFSGWMGNDENDTNGGLCKNIAIWLFAHRRLHLFIDCFLAIAYENGTIIVHRLSFQSGDITISLESQIAGPDELMTTVLKFNHSLVSESTRCCRLLALKFSPLFCQTDVPPRLIATKDSRILVWAPSYDVVTKNLPGTMIITGSSNKPNA